tara:strand:+ start:1717 stop:1902 length:186 start_codon:yes stop_codon:yes gene_type:complete
MARKKNQPNKEHWDDDQYNYKKALKREDRRSRRNKNKKYLKDVVRGEIDPDTYEDYSDGQW